MVTSALPSHRWLPALLVLTSLAVLVARPAAAAPRIQAPVRGAPLKVPGGGVVCDAGGGWTAAADGRLVPPRDPKVVGETAPIVVADDRQKCADEAAQRRFDAVTTGPAPAIDAIDYYLDEGRFEVTGRRLEGIQLRVQGARPHRCQSTETVGGKRRCDVNAPTNLPPVPGKIRASWLPAGALDDDGIHDARGRPVSAEEREVTIGRVILSRLAEADAVLDLSNGRGELSLVHPEAVASVECVGARCSLADGKVIVSHVDRAAARSKTPIVLRFRPQVSLLVRGKAVEEARLEVPVVFCPLDVDSGPPLRDVTAPRLVVRVDARCGAKAEELVWRVGTDEADVLKVRRTDRHVFVLLQARRLLQQRIEVSARLPGIGGSILAVSQVVTQDAPNPWVSLDLPGYGAIGFIPSNRRARLRVGAPRGGGRLVVVPVKGAYDVTRTGDDTTIRAQAGAGGFVALRFAFRWEDAEKIFPGADLAYLEEPTQRTIQQANVPVNLSVGTTAPPVVELVCSGRDGKPEAMPSGTIPHVPYARRHGCRLIIHQSRIPSTAGQQRLHLEVKIQDVAGKPRSSSTSEELVLSHMDRDRVYWIRGIEGEYDRAIVRVSHIVDDSQYLSPSQQRVVIPAAQWELVFESSSFRFYATAAIPASLFRFSDDPEGVGTGPLALNFGVLSRLTWLDQDGKEGLVGLEAGVMGMGLASSNDRQLNLVTGIGISVPLGNINQPTQAALNVHAWLAYRLGDQEGELADGRPVAISPWSFIFGPSVTIGSVGTNL